MVFGIFSLLSGENVILLASLSNDLQLAKEQLRAEIAFPKVTPSTSDRKVWSIYSKFGMCWCPKWRSISS